MRELINNALDLASLRKVNYADIRVVRGRMEEIAVKNGGVDTFTRDEDFGFGIRVLFQGAWGFACSSRVERKEMERVLDRAFKIARESSRIKEKEVILPPRPPVVARYQTPISIDPLQVSPEKKIQLLLEADSVLRRNEKVKIAEAFMGAYLTEKTFASTEGSFVEQKIVECGAGIAATAIEGRRSAGSVLPQFFPGKFCHQRLRMDRGVKNPGPCGKNIRGSGPASFGQALPFRSHHRHFGRRPIGPPGP